MKNRPTPPKRSNGPHPFYTVTNTHLKPTPPRPLAFSSMATPNPKVDPPSSHPFHPPLYGTFPSPQPYHAVPAGVAYQTAVVAEGLPVRIVRVRDPPLPFCGIGVGWALFVAGFFFAAVPWYVGAFILFFVSMDDREKAGLVACTVAAVLAAITAILGLSGHNPFW